MDTLVNLCIALRIVGLRIMRRPRTRLQAAVKRTVHVRHVMGRPVVVTPTMPHPVTGGPRYEAPRPDYTAMGLMPQCEGCYQADPRLGTCDDCRTLVKRTVRAVSRRMSLADAAAAVMSANIAAPGVDTAATAYDVMPDGFRLHGAHGSAEGETLPDPTTMTLAQLIAHGGELPGVRPCKAAAAKEAARVADLEAREAARVEAEERRYGHSVEAQDLDAGPGMEHAPASWSTSEGLADTAELSDDSDRWGHYADAHLDAERTYAAMTEHKAHPGTRLYMAKVDRIARTARLLWWSQAQHKATMDKARQAWGQRYTASVKAQGDSARLYLTRDQAEALRCIGGSVPTGTLARFAQAMGRLSLAIEAQARCGHKAPKVVAVKAAPVIMPRASVERAALSLR